MKGLFTQGIAILTERAIGLDELQALLPDHPFLRTMEAQEEWGFRRTYGGHRLPPRGQRPVGARYGRSPVARQYG
ncbi:MAG: hypothetical protein IPL39_04205 [Opitutaceae bacterium]|nr:hypothetical protein [Opitutaceae bacterium]